MYFLHPSSHFILFLLSSPMSFFHGISREGHYAMLRDESSIPSLLSLLPLLLLVLSSFVNCCGTMGCHWRRVNRCDSLSAISFLAFSFLFVSFCFFFLLLFASFALFAAALLLFLTFPPSFLHYFYCVSLLFYEKKGGHHRVAIMTRREPLPFIYILISLLSFAIVLLFYYYYYYFSIIFSLFSYCFLIILCAERIFCSRDGSCADHQCQRSHNHSHRRRGDQKSFIR